MTYGWYVTYDTRVLPRFYRPVLQIVLIIKSNIFDYIINTYIYIYQRHCTEINYKRIFRFSRSGTLNKLQHCHILGSRQPEPDIGSELYRSHSKFHFGYGATCQNQFSHLQLAIFILACPPPLQLGSWVPSSLGIFIEHILINDSDLYDDDI